MTDDLVKRLLDIAGDTNEENETIHEAANRIEKLEAALREIAYTEPEDKYWPGRIARKTLEGEE